MNKELISEVAKKESSQFNVYEYPNAYVVELSENFKRSFKDEVLTTTQFFIDEMNKKFKGVNLVKENDTVFINKGNQMSDTNSYTLDTIKNLNEGKKLLVKDPTTGQVREIELKQPEVKKGNFRPRTRTSEGDKKKNPRYWSNQYWDKESVTDLLNEIVEPESINVSDLNVKEELSPIAFDGDKLDPKIRKVLLKNAIEFIKYAKIEGLTFKDIILTGSMANYNYTDQSDFDVHVLMDFDQLSEDKEFIGEYFRNKKNLWGDNYPAHIKGHDIELYIQDTSEPHTSTGVYSLMNDEWLTKPIKKMIGIDTANVQLKAAHIMNAIEDLEDSAHSPKIAKKADQLMDRLKEMRKAGLENEGEFSTENIVFKILRNSDYIKRLADIKKDTITKELTLEANMHNLDEGNIMDTLRKYKNAGIMTLGIVVGALASGITADSIKAVGIDNKTIEKAQEVVTDKMSQMADYVGDTLDNYK